MGLDLNNCLSSSQASLCLVSNKLVYVSLFLSHTHNTHSPFYKHKYCTFFYKQQIQHHMWLPNYSQQKSEKQKMSCIIKQYLVTKVVKLINETTQLLFLLKFSSYLCLILCVLIYFASQRGDLDI